jgi:hypothetical protein
MLRRRLPLGAVIWIVVGVIVAATGDHNFFDHPDSLSKILSAVLAVLVWPLVLFKIHFGI